MAIDPEAVSFEIGYWLAMLDDVQKINAQAMALAGDVVRGDPDAALDKVAAMQDTLKELLRTIDGRVKAIRAEVGPA